MHFKRTAQAWSQLEALKTMCNIETLRLVSEFREQTPFVRIQTVGMSTLYKSFRPSRKRFGFAQIQVR